MKIQIVVWNTNGLALCETSSETVKEVNRNNFFKRLIRKDCVLVDFMGQIEKTINEQKVDLLIVLTVDARSGSKFHSDLLPDYMGRLDFLQLLRMKDNRVSGNSDFRISVYIRNEYYKNTSVKSDGDENCESMTGIIDRVGGVMGFRLNVPTVGKLGFIGAYLPESQKAFLDIERGDRSIHEYQHLIFGANNICLSGAMFRLWGKLDILDQPDITFVFGDLNYLVDIPDKNANEYITNNKVFSYQALKDYDGLKEAFKEGVLKNYQEGVGGVGPTHAPDYPLRINRKNDCATKGDCYAHKGIFPSWTQRILYNKIPHKSHNKVKCNEYSTMESENISKSNHSLLYGVYEIY